LWSVGVLKGRGWAGGGVGGWRAGGGGEGEVGGGGFGGCCQRGGVGHCGCRRYGLAWVRGLVWLTLSGVQGGGGVLKAWTVTGEVLMGLAGVSDGAVLCRGGELGLIR